MQDHERIQFGIKDIQQLDFFVDDTKSPELTYDVSYNTSIGVDTAEDLLYVDITVSFIDKEQHAVPFMGGRVETVFSILEIARYVTRRQSGPDVIDLPQNFLITLFSIAFSHARAVLAQSASATMFRHVILPIIDPTEEFKKAFQ